MFCNCVFIMFCLFVFTQIRWRWKSDAIITKSPWLVLWKGKTNNITFQTGTDFNFKAFSQKYGNPLIGFDDTTDAFFTRERTETEMQVSCVIYGPPLSFHRIALRVNNKDIRIVDVFIPYTGVAHSEMMARLLLADKTKIRVHHYFDSIWSSQYSSYSDIVVSFRSGIPNLYDAPWVYK